MGVLWGVLAVLAAFIWIVTLFDLFRRHLPTGTTVAWLLIVLILPFVGALAYWAMRKTPADEVERALDTERDIRRGAPPPRTH
jgi:drug/metabolite transporter (DMT)-like permease